MILSIGMIVKNEEKYLRACLDSIKPILEAVHSELIIYDTGSTDATVEIAKEFTDQVHVIEWRDDFAWARNHTIDRASGEWFMYVDADEVFTDVADIISFFNSGEYKNYNSASYRWRNLYGDGTFGTYSPIRLYKKVDGLRFIGKIHEAIDDKPPIKSLDSIADHFGYYFPGEEGKKAEQKKYERNIGLLLEMQKESPKDIRIMLLVAQEYVTAGKYDEVLQLFKDGMEVIGKNPRDIYYHVFTYKLVNYYYAVKDYKSLIDCVQEYFETMTGFNYDSQILIPIYHYYANALLKVDRYHDAEKAAEKLLEYFDLNKQGKLDQAVSGHTVFPWEYFEQRETHEYLVLVAATLRGNFDVAFKYADMVKDIKFDVFGTYLKNCIQRESWDEIPQLYIYALGSEKDSDMYHNAIASLENHMLLPEIKNNIARAFVSSPFFTDKNDDYIQLQILRNANTSSEDASLDYFLQSDRAFGQTYGDVILFAMKQLVSFSGFAEKMVITDSTSLIERILNTNQDAYSIIHKFFCKGRWDNTSAKVNRILSSLATLALPKFLASESEEEKVEFFEISTRLNHMYRKMVYSPSVYSAQNVASLSENDAFIYYAGTAYECQDVLGFVQNMRMAVAINPGMNDIVWLLVTRAKQEMEKALQ